MFYPHPWIYLTYEELKPTSFEEAKEKLGGFILPMRNWNPGYPLFNWGFITSDLSYLWGIETRDIPFLIGALLLRIYLTYEELKPDTVKYLLWKSFSGFILPMRNWNCDALIDAGYGGEGIYLTYEELKHGTSSHTAHHRQWIYLTYEELKQYKANQTSSKERGFILPMRNWNVCTRTIGRFPRYRIYLTYEELKLGFNLP